MINLIKSNLKSAIEKILSEESRFEEIEDHINFIEENIDNLDNIDEKKIIYKVLKVLDLYYYKENLSLVIDDVYDRLESRLEDIVDFENDEEAEHFKKAGYQSKEVKSTEKKNDFFPPQKHKIIAGSQGKVRFSEKDKFDKRVQDLNNQSVVISDKADGITLVMEYTKDYKLATQEIEELFTYQKEYLQENKEKLNKSRYEKILSRITKQKEKMISCISVAQNNGDFALAKILTRGDGIVGNNITFNAIETKNVHLNLPSNSVDSKYTDLVIRGEAVIKRSDFKNLPYKNPRNGVALLQKHEGDFADHVSFMPFELIRSNDKGQDGINRDEMFKWFKEQNFDILFNKTITDLSTLRTEILNRLSQRNESWGTYDGENDIFTDGIIISINDANERIELGMVGMKPKGEFAFKPDPELNYGKLQEIEWTVGKGGLITPVVILEKGVKISGTVINRITAANRNILKEMAPYVGAELGIVKRGEIIPKVESNLLFEKYNESIEKLITKVIESELLSKKETEKLNVILQENRIGKIVNFYLSKDIQTSLTNVLKNIFSESKSEKIVRENFKQELSGIVIDNEDLKDRIKVYEENQITHLTTCPKCGSTLKEEKVLLRCLNKSCEGRKTAQLTSFAQKLTKEIGEKTIEYLYKRGVLTDYHDFFTVTKESFKEEDGNYLPGWEEGSVNIFLEAVNNIRKTKDNEFMGSLFFSNIGSTMFQTIFQKIPLEDIKKELDTFEEEDRIDIEDVYKNVELQELYPKNTFIKNLEKKKYKKIDFIKTLASIGSVGGRTIQEIVNTWVEEKDSINKLFNEIEIQASNIISSDMESHTYCVTGSINELELNGVKLKNRADLTKYLKSIGHKVSGSVTKNTKALITDDELDPNNLTSKPKKANELNIPIITSNELSTNPVYGALNTPQEQEIEQGKSKTRGP